jgi:hypothetical protein
VPPSLEQSAAGSSDTASGMVCVGTVKYEVQPRSTIRWQIPRTSQLTDFEDLQRGPEPGLEKNVEDLGLLLRGVVLQQPRAATATAQATDTVELR